MKSLNERAEEIIRRLVTERDKPCLPIVLEGMRDLTEDCARFIEEASRSGRVLTDHAFSQGANYGGGICKCGLGRDAHRKRRVKRAGIIARLRKLAREAGE